MIDSHLSDAEIICKGIACSQGISIGTAKVIKPESLDISYEKIPNYRIKNEIDRYEKAVNALTKELNDLISSVKTESRNIMDILESNLMITTDPVLKKSVIEKIQTNLKAEAGIFDAFEEQVKIFKDMDDEYLRTRSEDLEHIRKRLLFILRHKLTDFQISEDTIIIAQSLMPSDIINFRKSGVMGIVTEIGGISSHVSILTRSCKIPSVIGLRDVLRKVKTGDTVIVNGSTGTLYINPSDSLIEKYKEKIAKIEEHNEQLGKLKDAECVTTDGHRIKVYTNIDLREDVIFGEASGSDGVGLMRTESLIVTKGRFPTFEEQLEFYTETAEISYPNNITIRAFDIGSDKFSEALPHTEDNPALGCRGIRFLLQRKDIFKLQVKAVLMASKNKNIKFMLPMVSEVSEVVEARKFIEKCKKELEADSISFDKNLPIGIMIETPAAAIMAETYVDICDFFSIGTNDLTQYTMGVDRGNEMVSNLFNPYHPAVFRLIKRVVDETKDSEIPITICGEIAAYTDAIPILLGIGITELSVSPSMVLETKNVIINSSKKEAHDMLFDFLDTFEKNTLSNYWSISNKNAS
jgi:phosphotransferase system enzyme I (PtsI)